MTGRPFSFWREALHRAWRVVKAVAAWSMWLALGSLLVFQLYMATHHELAVPNFVLRALEQRLAASGLHADFGRTQFDPSGRILVRDVRITLPGFEEPVVSAGAIYGRLDWWALLAGRFEPLEVRVTGVVARVPAMLSPSGRADEVVHDLDGTFFPRGGDVDVPFLTGYIGAMKVAARGTLHLAAGRSGTAGPLPLADLLARQYARWSRQAAAAGGWLAAVDEPVLRADFVPIAPGVSQIDFSLCAEGAKAPAPWVVEGTGLRFFGTWIAGAEEGTPGTLQISAHRLAFSGLAAAEDFAARLQFTQHKGGAESWPIAPRVVDFAARAASGGGIALAAPAGRVQLADWPRIDAEIGARLWDHSVLASAQGDARARSGAVRFDLAIGAGVLEAVAVRWHRDLRPFLNWTEPIALQGSAQFEPGGRFAGASGRIRARGLNARGVKIDELDGELRFDGRNLLAPAAYARLGEDFAHGSFAQEMGANHYRFLLEGRLRPLDITPWIAGEWWKEFFSNLDFPLRPPDADMDLRGSWTDGRQAKIFLRVNAPGISVRGLTLDELTGRLFVRPQFIDVLAFAANRGAGEAAGTFSRRYDLDRDDWRSMDVALTSTLDPAPALKLLGPEDSAALSDFIFAAPPHLEVTGHFDGPAGPAGEHRQVKVRVRSEGPATYQGIPLDGIAFDAAIADSAIVIDSLTAAVAGGTVTGRLRLDGDGAARRLDFAASARDVSLTKAAALVQKISATPPGPKAAQAEKFLQDKSSVKIDATVAAQGRLASLNSFSGSGSAELHGGEIGEIHMLGLLSSLLRFTSLRFTAARATFQLRGPQLTFPEVVISGANSAISAHGVYSLPLHQLDFRARLDPFKQSRGATRKFMDLVLTPLSNALEVRLTGSIEKPKWAFVNGPTNLLWSLSSPNSVAPAQTRFANPP